MLIITPQKLLYASLWSFFCTLTPGNYPGPVKTITQKTTMMAKVFLLYIHFHFLLLPRQFIQAPSSKC